MCDKSLSIDEELIMGALLPMIAVADVLIKSRVISASSLREKALSMLEEISDNLPAENQTNQVRTGLLTLLTILSDYENDPDPSPDKSRPDWLRAVIEGGRDKSGT